MASHNTLQNFHTIWGCYRNFLTPCSLVTSAQNLRVLGPQDHVTPGPHSLCRTSSCKGSWLHHTSGGVGVAAGGHTRRIAAQKQGLAGV